MRTLTVRTLLVYFAAISTAARANEYYQAQFSCVLSGTTETVKTRPTALPNKVNFDYSAVFFWDREWKIASSDLNASDKIKPILFPHVGSAQRAPGSLYSGMYAFPVLTLTTIHKSVICTALSQLGDKTCNYHEAFSNLAPMRPIRVAKQSADQYAEVYINKSDTPALRWGRKSQVHWPLDARDGLSYHILVQCTGACVSRSTGLEGPCPFWD